MKAISDAFEGTHKNTTASLAKVKDEENKDKIDLGASLQKFFKAISDRLEGTHRNTTASFAKVKDEDKKDKIDLDASL